MHHSSGSFNIASSVYFRIVLLCSLASGPTTSRFAARPFFFDQFTFSNYIASTACGTWAVVWIASVAFAPKNFIVFCIVEFHYFYDSRQVVVPRAIERKIFIGFRVVCNVASPYGSSALFGLFRTRQIEVLREAAMDSKGIRLGGEKLKSVLIKLKYNKK